MLTFGLIAIDVPSDVPLVKMQFNGHIFELIFPVKLANINLAFLKHTIVWLFNEMPIILFLNISDDFI